MSGTARQTADGRAPRVRKGVVFTFLVALVAAGAVLLGVQGEASAQSASGTVLILDSSVFGGDSSAEAVAAIEAGYDVEVVDAAGWRAKSTADFASYRAIVLGDPDCGSVSAVQAAADTTAVWGPAITGNVLVDGTDPVFHAGQGGSKLTDGAVRFAADEPGKTGAYISLSCYYDGTEAMTPVPVLDGLAPGGFTVTGVPGCFDAAHIVASHPALVDITDEDLSNWGCSVHEAFDAWPDDFLVLAIALTGDVYQAPDGTVGTPYILARGEQLEVISDIRLTQETSSRAIGENHEVTATVVEGEGPLVGATVTFTVLSGPHAGAGGTADTGSDGTATFSYRGTKAGTDTIEASFVDAQEKTQKSNRLAVTWGEDAGTPPDPDPDPAPDPGPDLGPPVADVSVSLSSSAATAGVGDAVTFTGTVTNRGPGAATGVTVLGSASQAVRIDSVTLVGAGPCPVSGNAFTCPIGTLTTGGSATVTATGTVVSAGNVLATMSASADQSDPNEADNSASATLSAPTGPGDGIEPDEPTGPLPPPRLGRTVNVTPVRGIVLVNGKRLQAGEQIPVGAIVNTRRGVVELESFNGTARFRDGLFRILEPRVRGGFTNLKLLGGNFLAGCGHPALRRPNVAEGVETHRKKTVRRLWGNGKGRFRTTGRYSAATVRGTVWLTADRCDGTLTTVRQGRVVVFDTVLKKRVAVRAGRSYLARARNARP